MMFRDVLAAVRAEVSGERAHAALRDIARFHRIQASPGYDAAADWLAVALAPTGLEVEVEHVPADGATRLLGQLMPEGWAAERGAAWLVDAAGAREPLCDFGAEPLSLIQRSESASGRFPLVAFDDPDGTPRPGADVRGAVALTHGFARASLEQAVRERGAAGLLCDGRRLFPPVRADALDRDSLAYTSFWWNGDEPRGWGFVVTPNVGATLRGRLDRGERLALDVDLATRRYATRIPLVTARLAGESDREILVVSHLCHPRPGANDNASGAAAALETARTLAALASREPLRRRALSVRFLWMPELTGTFAWLGAEPARIERLVAGLNLDMVGADQTQTGSTFLLEHPPCFAASFAEELLQRIRAEARDWITSYSGPGHFSLDRMAEVPYSGGSDHAVLVDPTIGVPCPLLIQWPDRFYHSSFDTPERCDPRSLALAARCAATYAGALAVAGETERRALATLVARGARRRVLEALDRPEPERALARERVRGATALASLGRLDTPFESELAAFESFVADAASARDPERRADGSAVPVRTKRGPLDFLDHLVPGYDRLAAADRAAWRALRARHVDPALELAWFAADGRRNVAEIARLVWLETGQRDVAAVTEYFELMAKLGIAELR